VGAQEQECGTDIYAEMNDCVVLGKKEEAANIFLYCFSRG